MWGLGWFQCHLRVREVLMLVLLGCPGRQPVALGNAWSRCSPQIKYNINCYVYTINITCNNTLLLRGCAQCSIISNNLFNSQTMFLGMYVCCSPYQFRPWHEPPSGQARATLCTKVGSRKYGGIGNPFSGAGMLVSDLDPAPTTSRPDVLEQVATSSFQSINLFIIFINH